LSALPNTDIMPVLMTFKPWTFFMVAIAAGGGVKMQ
jgi:hypothetical protein